MAVFYRVAFVLCACFVSAHRLHRQGMQIPLWMLDLTPSEEHFRAAALKSFKPPPIPVGKWRWETTVKIRRHSKTSIFEQTRYQLEEFHPKLWAENWTSESLMFGFEVKFKGEEGVDMGGLAKEWLSLCLQSIVMPEGHPDEAGLACIKSGSCGRNASAPQYLLEALPSGVLIPISVEQVEKPESSESKWAVAGHRVVGSAWKYAYGAYKSAYKSASDAYQAILGPKEPEVSMPAAALMRFKFLGKWLARAYIISGLGYAPMGMHGLIYQSLLAGHTVAPKSEPFYSKEDTIPACEKLAAIVQRRSPQELQSYGWLKCDELKDPDTGKYIQPSCYKPIYKDEMMWDALYLAWGSLAPDGAKADDPVPFEKAREFTELQCETSWKHFEEPVNSMAQGFHEVIPSDSEFYQLLNGDSEKLKDLIEGKSEVDLDEMWEAVNWTDWKEEQKEVLRQVFEEMQEEGKDLPPLKRPLNKLLHFFTGSFKQPVEGWKTAKVEFTTLESERCMPLVGKTCFNELRIPSGCLESPNKLKEMIAESIVSEGFGME